MKFQQQTLRNGIKVFHEFRDLPVVCLGIINLFGASHETADIKGIAHVIEHLLFTGTKKRSHEEISGEIEKRGGVLNAFTANDITGYWFKLPSEHLFIGMEILADMLKNTAFDAEKFDKEKKVILEELKMYNDNPQRHVLDLIEESLYEKPFGMGIMGTKETISGLKRDFVAKYFSDKYSSNNFIVSIVGNADFDKICSYLDKEFDSTIKNLHSVPIKKKNANLIEERGGLDQAQYVWASHAPDSAKERYVLEVLDAYLTSGGSSKLFLEIREKKGLAYVVRGSINAEKNYSYYSIYIGTTKEAIPDVQKLILEGFGLAEKMTEKELEDAKERLIGLRKISSEESINVMNELVSAEISAGGAGKYYDYESKIKAVSLSDVRKLARNLPRKFSTAAIVPK